MTTENRALAGGSCWRKSGKVSRAAADRSAGARLHGPARCCNTALPQLRDSPQLSAADADACYEYTVLHARCQADGVRDGCCDQWSTCRGRGAVPGPTVRHYRRPRYPAPKHRQHHQPTTSATRFHPSEAFPHPCRLIGGSVLAIPALASAGITERLDAADQVQRVAGHRGLRHFQPESRHAARSGRASSPARSSTTPIAAPTAVARTCARAATTPTASPRCGSASPALEAHPHPRAQRGGRGP